MTLGRNQHPARQGHYNLAGNGKEHAFNGHETALFWVLGSEAAVAFAVALYFLTTLLACTYLDRFQGTLFATGAFLVQALSQLANQYGLVIPPFSFLFIET